MDYFPITALSIVLIPYLSHYRIIYFAFFFFWFTQIKKSCPELRLVSCQCPCPLPVIHLNHRTTFPTIHNLPPCQVINTKPYSDSKFYLSHTVHNYIHYITCCIMKRPISWMITRLLSHFSTCLNHNCKF